jgi:hypothetical protein
MARTTHSSTSATSTYGKRIGYRCIAKLLLQLWTLCMHTSKQKPLFPCSSALAAHLQGVRNGEVGELLCFSGQGAEGEEAHTLHTTFVAHT